MFGGTVPQKELRSGLNALLENVVALQRILHGSDFNAALPFSEGIAEDARREGISHDWCAKNFNAIIGCSQYCSQRGNSPNTRVVMRRGKGPLSHCSAPAQKHCWHVRKRGKRSLWSGKQRQLRSCLLDEQLKLQKESTRSHLISLALDGSLGGSTGVIWISFTCSVAGSSGTMVPGGLSVSAIS